MRRSLPKAWDLWIDFQRGDGDGLTAANARNVRAGLGVNVGDVLIVGNEDAERGVGQIVALVERGALFVRVFPGTVEDNRDRMSPHDPVGS